jgi:pyrroloquinoline quinone biosynthesis protein B
MYLGRETMDATVLPVWAAPRLVSFLTSNGPWEQLVTSGNIDLRVIEPGNAIRLSDHVRVEAIEVPHRDEYSETVGFRVTGPECNVLYVPDTDGWDGWDPPVEDHIRQVDIALLDATFFSHDELPGRDISKIAHPLVSESLTRFAALDDRDRSKIRFTHLNHSNPLLNPNSDESVAVARSGMSVAQEGDVYRL